jgi:hypothetical protein
VSETGTPGWERSWAFTMAFWLTIVSGSILVAHFVVDVPVTVVFAALAGFLIGCVIVSVLVVRDARRTGISRARAFGRGLKAAAGWLLGFMP